MSSRVARVADFLRRQKNSLASRWRPPASVMSPGRVGVVGLMVDEGDRRVLAGVCRRYQWNLFCAATQGEAQAALTQLRAPVVLCDRDLAGNGWRETVAALAASPQRACVILVSGVVNVYLWYEVVRTGGFDMLAKPLREEDVVRAVRLAWSYWNSNRNRVIGRSGDRRIGRSGDWMIGRSGDREIG